MVVASLLLMAAGAGEAAEEVRITPYPWYAGVEGTLVGGWRYLEPNHEDGTYKFDAALTRPFMGASFAF